MSETETVTFKYDEKKAINVVLFISERIPSVNVYAICKLFYLADKLSLEKRGRFICGESYSAMANGPVPSHTWDLLKKVKKISSDKFAVKNDYKIVPSSEPNLDWFSQCDIECLSKVIEENKGEHYWKIRKKTHDSAYKEAWAKRENAKSVPMPVLSIAKQFEESEYLIDYLVNG